MPQRLNKFLASAGVASRRNSDELILEGRISVNDKIVLEPGLTIDEERDKIYFDGEQVRLAKKVYYLMNKPRGVVTTTDDEKKRKTAVSLLPAIPKVFPVGRLDINTTGLLLLTNDGDFSNYLLHPSNGFLRVYIAVLSVPLDEKRKLQLEKGIMLEKKFSKFKKIEFVSKNKSIVRVTAAEGRNHFVKKMFSTLGIFVNELHREKLGPFELQSIPPGSYTKLHPAAIKAFMEEGHTGK